MNNSLMDLMDVIRIGYGMVGAGTGITGILQPSLSISQWLGQQHAQSGEPSWRGALLEACSGLLAPPS